MTHRWLGPWRASFDSCTNASPRAELTASEAGRCCDEQEFRALGGLLVYKGAIWGRQIGNPGLMLAVANAHYELASYFLDREADPNTSSKGWTALHLISWVRKHGTGGNDPAPEGSGTMGSLDFVKRLVARGGDLKCSDNPAYECRDSGPQHDRRHAVPHGRQNRGC